MVGNHTLRGYFAATSRRSALLRLHTHERLSGYFRDRITSYNLKKNQILTQAALSRITSDDMSNKRLFGARNSNLQRVYCFPVPASLSRDASPGNFREEYQVGFDPAMLCLLKLFQMNVTPARYAAEPFSQHGDRGLGLLSVHNNWTRGPAMLDAIRDELGMASQLC